MKLKAAQTGIFTKSTRYCLYVLTEHKNQPLGNMAATALYQVEKVELFTFTTL